MQLFNASHLVYSRRDGVIPKGETEKDRVARAAPHKAAGRELPRIMQYRRCICKSTINNGIRRACRRDERFEGVNPEYVGALASSVWWFGMY
ncbi:hypothetical protein EVAR_7247_1 [Eumeta japonica]|uniref:Uncharacterized protein n=1 Tax=Eumeta variegata TaxID=151549 RepID=A0A4C1T2B3_EUMVA|nr:hypothetical protein EVAR_7247_1 [Eumeta japonica]